MRRLMVSALILTAGSPLVAAETCATLEPKAVAALFDDWNFALSSLDSNQVVQRYWPNAVLLPTVSNTPRTSPAMIGDYFEHFLARRPRGHIDTRTVQVGCNMAMDVGTYTFSLMDDKGVTSDVAARYTFIYQYRDGAWKILHHHSSAMPESSTGAMPAEAHAATEKAPVAAKPVPAVAAAPAPAPVITPVIAPSRPRIEPKVDARIPPKPPAQVAAPAMKPQPAVSENKTSMFANLASSPPPSKFYPPEAGKRKEHGNVNLKVCADGEGAVAGTPEVMKSSGSKLLDEAALTWARAVKWVPATLNHQRVEGCTQVDVSFEAAA